jgi:hypothetical protein
MPTSLETIGYVIYDDVKLHPPESECQFRLYCLICKNYISFVVHDASSTTFSFLKANVLATIWLKREEEAGIF